VIQKVLKYDINHIEVLTRSYSFLTNTASMLIK